MDNWKPKPHPCFKNVIEFENLGGLQLVFTYESEADKDLAWQQARILASAPRLLQALEGVLASGQLPEHGPTKKLVQEAIRLTQP